MTLTIRLDTTSWSSPHAAPSHHPLCRDPDCCHLICCGCGCPGSRVQPGRAHDEMRCAAALHSDTALWETRYRYLHSIIYTLISTNRTAFPICPTTLESLRPQDGVKQTTLHTSCQYIPAVQCECDHVTAPRQHQREKVQNLIKKIID